MGRIRALVRASIAAAGLVLVLTTPAFAQVTSSPPAKGGYCAPWHHCLAYLTLGVVAEVRKDFREFTRRSDDLVRDFTGLVPPTPAPNPIVLDRGGWVRANIESFQGLIRPLAEKLSGSISIRGPMRRITAGALGV